MPGRLAGLDRVGRRVLVEGGEGMEGREGREGRETGLPYDLLLLCLDR